MIPFDFAYYRPDTLQEAVDAFAKLQSEGKTPLYYAGGSEIITMCRAGDIRPDAVIDIKNIPECMILSADQRELKIGSVCTLSQISESGLFPLMRLSCGRIADHSNQCRITLGGNLCGTIQYREASLPLLLADADIVLYGPSGERVAPFKQIFQQRMRLKPGEMIVRVHVPGWALSARAMHIKKTRNEKIDYPLVSVAAIRTDNRLRLSFSGVCAFPFRSEAMESVANDRAKSISERADRMISLLPAPVLSDVEGSGAYRLFVLKNTLRKLLEAFENDQI